MSLSTALNAAASGLHVTARATQVVADNIANAGTDGYGVRSLTQAARAVGGTGSGVIATGIDRNSDPVLIGAARLAAAEQQAAAGITEFWTQIEQSLGQPGFPGALVTQVSKLDAALSTAIAAPETQAVLARVAQGASDVVQAFNATQRVIAQARDHADLAVSKDINSLNDLLSDVARLNKDIQRQAIIGVSPNALMDQRQRLTDQIALILPVTEIARDFGRVMLIAADGTVLVDQNAASFGFQRSPNPQPGDTALSGGVAPITLGSRSIGAGHPMLGQGRLGAALAVRDEHAPLAQTELDHVAADIVARFASPTADPTLPPGAFGLFVDPSAAPPLNSSGLSGRIALSPLVQPDQPSTLWRLRDGLGAIASGPVGATAGLASLRGALAHMTTAGSSAQSLRDVHGHAVDLSSLFSTNRLHAETREAQSASRATVLQGQLQAMGVDTDEQMQKLLVLEQSYAANAKVISALDQMMRTLLEI